MPDMNPFPESDQKAFLRRHHLHRYLAPHRERLGRDLAYFGLPSAEMYDVELWRRVLGQITAVERDPAVALAMFRTAQKLGVRGETIIIELDLTETARLFVLDEREVELSLSLLPAPVANSIRRARSIGYDVINFDLCGGFLYPNQRGESRYEKMLRNLIRFQARQRSSFILIVTFNTRDTGKSEYDRFVAETLAFLDYSGADTAELRRFYTAKTVKGQPPNLRRLRFCIPTYIHKISYEHFEVQGLGAWYYKTFYHAVLFFELRQGTGILGPWPPPDEIKDLLRTSLMHIVLEGGEIILNDLPAPSLS